MFERILGGLMIIFAYTNVWCAALEDNGNGTVTDFNTGLTWQQVDDNVPRTLLEAQNYCDTLPLAGRTDWRLPNIKELTSIADNRVENPAIDDAMFPSTNLYYYKSSSSYASDNTLAWIADFRRFNVTSGRKTNHYHVRCVRQEQ